MSEPGVEEGDQKIDRDVDRNEDDGEYDHESLNERQIAIDHGLDRHVSNAGISENALDNNSAADEEGELDASERERWADRVAQRLLQDDAQGPTCP